MRSCHPQFEHIPANKTLIVKYIYSNEIRQNITDNAENISKNAEKNRCIGLTAVQCFYVNKYAMRILSKFSVSIKIIKIHLCT